MSEPWDPRHSALVIVDYQNDFCHEDGAVARMGHASEPSAAIQPRIADVLESARASGMPRIFVRVVHSEWTDTPAWTDRGSESFHVPVVREGTWGAEFYKISPRPDELIITKHRYSAFLFTPLKLALEAKGASSIVIVGVQTDVCVHATARDAMQEGFVPIVVEDCVATRDQEAHDTALQDIRVRVGLVVNSSDIHSAWS
ncbi:MAG: isochorismatase family protein [Actinobacteria bacterium]|nr:isochorismatase family protein [Actinomycetota bacterium]